ncbi:nucleoside hydrolase [Nocardia sp. BMG51109]|uniref:nucleoside hydrolase n=1 Tax=Nocardia sp. BMG51109 TaxID=1056816 RepID=UPI0004677720|nr:nucleoside hydrolase [Nocardia sp. BMG51109]
MGDIDNEDADETFESASGSLPGFAERYADLGFGPLAERLRGDGPPPPPVRGTPLIIDTDIGGDPDDALAIACAARGAPELALVLTTDENHGGRARFARHLLDLLDRQDIPVVAGADLGNNRYYVVDDLVPDDVPRQPTDVLDAVRTVCAATDGPVRWVGMGPLTNLAEILRRAPELARRLVVTQMGGAINYRDPRRAEHNFRLDPAAARHVVDTVPALQLVLSDITFTDETAVDADTAVYKSLAEPGSPAWAALLTAHLDRWFRRFHPRSMQHDPLALTAALQLPFVDFGRRRLTLAEDARMSADAGGSPLWVSGRADYPAFRTWLADLLTP